MIGHYTVALGLLGLVVSSQPITGCPKFINERSELVTIKQIDTFKRDGKRYYIGEEQIVKTNASIDDFIKYKCNEKEVKR